MNRYSRPVLGEHHGTLVVDNESFEAWLGPRCDMAEAVEFLRTAADLVQSELDAEAAESTTGDCDQSEPEPPDHPMVVNIRPGDVLVVHTDKRSSKDDQDRLKSRLAEVAPGAKLFVVDDGAALSHILRPSA